MKIAFNNIFFKRLVLILGVMLQLSGLSAQKRLLILNAYNEGAPWAQEIIAPIMHEVSGMDNFQAVEVVHMNSTLIHNERDYANMAQGIFRRFEERKPDYLVLLGNLAFTLRDRIVEEWGDVPMLLVAQSDMFGPQEFYYTYPDENETLCRNTLLPLTAIHQDYNFSLVMTPNLYKETVDMMKHIFPDMRKLVFIADALYINRHLNHEIRDYLNEKYPGMDYEWLVASEENGWRLQQYLNNQDYDVGMLLSTWFFERMTVHGYPQLIAGEARMISGSHRPVFGLRSAYFSYGIVGGYFPSPEELRQDVLDGLHDLLSGRDMREIPFRRVKHSFPIVNYSTLVRDDIPAGKCPEGTVFINRPKTFWELYRVYIVIGGILLLAAIGMLVTRVVFQRRKIAMMRARDRLVGNMPIGYSQATVLYDGNGRVTDISYHDSNETFNGIIRRNPLRGHPDKLFDKTFIAEITERLLSTREAVQFSYHFAATDTHYEFLVSIDDDGAGRVDEINVFAVDITDKCKAEHAALEMAHKLNATINAARIVPWRWDLRKREISCEVRKMLNRGYFNPDAAYGENIQIPEEDYFDRIYAEDVGRVREACCRFREGELQYVRMEYRYVRRRNGHPVVEWVEVNATVTEYDATHKPAVVIGSLIIISERKKREMMLITAREKAMESDKLKMAFLANMSHEIRTPLNAIVGFSNLLVKTTDEEKKSRFVELIGHNNRLLLKLIGDIIDVAKIESNTFELNYRPTELNRLLMTIGSTAGLRLNGDVVLNHVMGAPSCCIKTDPDRLSQVLVNLLINAVKFTRRGSITFGYELRGEKLYFYVRDTGIGISPENQGKLFLRFMKVDNFAQGTGLGLTICKSIVERLGGEIGVESAGEGKGSLFWFTIPYEPADSEHDSSDTTYYQEL